MRISIKHWLRLRREPWRKIFYDAFKAFRRDKRQAAMFAFDGLGPESVVLDFGGFEGNWADRIHSQYGCFVHVFEPHPGFAHKLQERFRDNPKITVHDYALGTRDGVLELSDDGDATSALQSGDTVVEGRVVAVQSFFDADPDQQFALAKINIEGGEYDLLPALLDTGAIERIDCLQVQFHLYSEALIASRAQIVERIEATHAPDWSYPFVWEQWTRKR